MDFKIEKNIAGALGRAGVLHTAHGVIHTPAFVPVGTKATVKALTPEQVRELGAEVVLANTYHLYLQPGDELVREAGGLHKFMNWPGPTMTDSGGFQVFSLGAAFGKDFSKIIRGLEETLQIPERFDDTSAPKLAKIGEDGVSFKSHLDGSLHYITPEKSIQIQHNLGADIIFAFDEATSPYENQTYQEDALRRTHVWAKRSLEEHRRLLGRENIFERPSAQRDGASKAIRQQANMRGESENDFPGPALFGIVQGGLDPELRKQSAEYIGNMQFDGFGIGGTYTKEHLHVTVKLVNEILPPEKPRHLLGIGEPEDLFLGIENGVDLFDCVAPTRNARNGTLYTSKGKINIMNEKFKNQMTPLEEGCGCYTCKNYTAAYLSHLFRGKEMQGGTLATIHNLYFIVNLVKNIRQSILDGKFHEYKQGFFDNYNK